MREKRDTDVGSSFEVVKFKLNPPPASLVLAEIRRTIQYNWQHKETRSTPGRHEIGRKSSLVDQVRIEASSRCLAWHSACFSLMTTTMWTSEHPGSALRLFPGTTSVFGTSLSFEILDHIRRSAGDAASTGALLIHALR